MRKIQNIDLDERYKAHYNGYSSSDCYEDSSLHLIGKLQEESNPVKFREELMAIIQLYFDGIVEETGSRKEQPKYADKILKFFKPDKNERDVPDEWKKQKEILDRLFMAGKDLIGAFYSGEDADLHEIGKIVSADAVEIAKNSGEKTAKSRHLGGQSEISSVQRFGLYLQDELERTGPFDSLVCVASGGFEPSFLAMYITGSEHMIPIRYSHLSRDDREVKIPRRAPQDYASSIKGKRVLVIDDWVASGKSLAKAMKYSAEMGAIEVYGIAVNGYPDSLPDVEVLGTSPYMCKFEGLKKSD